MKKVDLFFWIKLAASLSLIIFIKMYGLHFVYQFHVFLSSFVHRHKKTHACTSKVHERVPNCSYWLRLIYMIRSCFRSTRKNTTCSMRQVCNQESIACFWTDMQFCQKKQEFYTDSNELNQKKIDSLNQVN